MNTLYYGDNLEVLREYVPAASVDLVYLDPPFNSNATYNVLFAEQDGTQAASQIKAFEDTWHWDQAASRAYEEVVSLGGKVGDAMQAFHTLLGPSNMVAYLAMMAPRLTELHRVLKPTGSLYLHCDPTASHYLKMLMDAVFGPANFRNEIVWRYKKYQKAEMHYFTRNSDRILFYVRSAEADERFQPQFIALEKPKRFLKRSWDKDTQRIVNAKDEDGHVQYIEVDKEKIDDVWALTYLMPAARERLGYPTQKPEALLDRILLASSRPGEVVLDPFCGCGTTIASAQRLNRQWIGIDVTNLAISLIRARLRDQHGEAIEKTYHVIGEPKSEQDARVLAAENPYQFQWWALGLVGARPAEQKKGADRGIDGRIVFFDDASRKAKSLILSVKAGGVQVSHVRDLVGVLDREKAVMGVLISLEEPTRNMRQEAAEAGFYTSDWGKHPRVQLLTVGQLLQGRTIDMPPRRQVDATLKRAPKVAAPIEQQRDIFDVDGV